MASQLPNPNTTTFKPLNPFALPYQKPPLQMEQLQQPPSLLLSKPYLPHQIYHFQPTLIHPPSLTFHGFPTSTCFLSPPTLIYQNNNLNFPVWITHHPLPTLPQVVNIPCTTHYTTAQQLSSPPVLDPPSEEEKEQTFGGCEEVEKSSGNGRVNGCKGIGKRRARFNLPPRFRALKGEVLIPKDRLNRKGIVVKGREGEGEKDGEVELKRKTSLMIRNIPNKLERHHLMEILDKYCLKENNKELFGSDPIPSEYDFLYLPMDFKRRANLGYGFVNFTNEVAASRFWKAFNGYKWRGSQNQKTCEITFAIYQGKEALQNHFRGSHFPCHTNSYLPVIFSPPRDGATETPPTLVGRRVTAPFPSTRTPSTINQEHDS